MKQYVQERLSEPSTWRGLSLLLGCFGIAIDPSLLLQIGTGVASVISMTQIFSHEK